MRTLVTLDSDVEQIIRERMAAFGVSFKEALNDSVRGGASERATYVFRTPTFDLGVPKVDLTKANALAAELDYEYFLAN
ncbi:MAG: hypothetical protein KDB38_04425 [Nocardioidaceae bacterium]|nr:hypothetical protein [Nocardioidaceae bacterium]MCO5324842.1 hypothetical protein [Nocardioidaceae bacterium]